MGLSPAWQQPVLSSLSLWKPVNLSLLFPRRYPSYSWEEGGVIILVTVSPFPPRSCSSHIFFLFKSPVTSLSQSSIVNGGKEVCEYSLFCATSHIIVADYRSDYFLVWFRFFSDSQFSCSTGNCFIYPTSNCKPLSDALPIFLNCYLTVTILPLLELWVWDAHTRKCSVWLKYRSWHCCLWQSNMFVCKMGYLWIDLQKDPVLFT